MAISDYINRKYDFLALQNTDPTRRTRLDLELALPGVAGQITTGPQKLAQRWVLEFLTERGSMPGLPNRGTNFMTLVRQGQLTSEAAVLAAFRFAAYDTRINLGNEEDSTWPDDERISDATVQSIAFLPGYAQINVIISSRAGDTRAIILPVSTLPKNLT